MSRKTSHPPPEPSVGEPRCPHRPPCPGCPRFGAPSISALAKSRLDQLAIVSGLPEVSVVNGATAGFRHRARLALRGRMSTPKVGLFESDTHRVVHIPACSVQHELINRVANVVRRALVETRTSCYSDGAHLGLARYLQVVVERSSQTAQIVLVGNSADAAPFGGCFDLLRERLGSSLHSLWFNSNCERGNSILGPHFEHIYGPQSVIEHFGGAAIHYPPGAFGQNNLDIAQLIIEEVRQTVPSQSRVTEFYAGVGAIGLSVLDGAAQLRLNESNAHSLQGLHLGVDGLEPSQRLKVSIAAGAAGDIIAAADGSDVVICDPPRKGLDPPLVQYLCDAPPQKFIYVSCSLDSFMSDSSRLLSAGKLRLGSLRAYNLIPFTDHVEILACFERQT